MNVFVCGYPGALGGADTELWHVLNLWSANGLKVHLLPTYRPYPKWRARCDELGFRTTELNDVDWDNPLPTLKDSIVISFCSGDFLRDAHKFRGLGCKLVWVNCMTWLFEAEVEFCKKHGTFDAYVFQSGFQQEELLPQLEGLGATATQCYLVPGAFAFDEFPFNPNLRTSSSTFCVGKLARPDPDKWPADLWNIIDSIGDKARCARVMGWSEKLYGKLGMAPSWAEVLQPCQEESRVFLSSLHTLLAVNGGARENWPRVGLESMSTGVPVIAHDAWGWREMIVHGETGFLAKSSEEFSILATALAKDEALRQQIIRNARARLVDYLAEPNRIWAAWRRLFAAVGGLH